MFLTFVHLLHNKALVSISSDYSLDFWYQHLWSSLFDHLAISVNRLMVYRHLTSVQGKTESGLLVFSVDLFVYFELKKN